VIKTLQVIKNIVLVVTLLVMLRFMLIGISLFTK